MAAVATLTSPHRRCQMLYAPTGSVTTETWLDYLDFILPKVDNPMDAIVTTTDRYAPHLSVEAKDFSRPTKYRGGPSSTCWSAVGRRGRTSSTIVVSSCTSPTATAVDATEDDHLDSSGVHFWERPGMKEVREQIAVQVRSLVRQRTYTVRKG